MSRFKVFKYLFITAAVFLPLLPFLVSVSEGLTKFIETISLYKLLQQTIVPFEIKIVGAMLTLMGISTQIQLDGLVVNGTFLRLSWNCIGWQSLIFLLISFGVGFQGRYTRKSLLETIVIGILGTYILNITRITFISLLGAFAKPVFVYVFHDYLAVVVTICWLIVFWWFSYRYVLEEVE